MFLWWPLWWGRGKLQQRHNLTRLGQDKIASKACVRTRGRLLSSLGNLHIKAIALRIWYPPPYICPTLGYPLDTMAPSKIVDSHIHLWPQSASNENGHTWMTPGMPLAKQHVLSDYYQASKQDFKDSGNIEVDGVVYVETDRRYSAPSGDLAHWAENPLDEVKFVRRIVEGQYGERDSRMLRGIVLWAPMNQSPETLRQWLGLVEEIAGDATWKRVKGFRFLLQAIHDQEEFGKLVLGEDFAANLKILGERGFSFDLGVDQHSGGPWQLELVYTAMQQAHEGVSEEQKVCFIVNHLCKPDFSNVTTPSHGDVDYYRWTQSIEKMSHMTNTYMKLSGAFSELPERPTATTDVAAQIKPWVQQALKHFGPARVMFGSDWPVCNVNGPEDDSPWVLWTSTVKELLNDLVTVTEQERVWSGTAIEAYRL
jgi:L-rhamnono-1,4-lactonase